MFADKEYIINLRRELHAYPEIGLDLPQTALLVKRELESIGISYTEKYGKSSVVASINDDKKFTIGIRADMDALLVQEINNVPYKSKIDGRMHACGHDAHTAMLLGTAKALCGMKDKINCRIKLIFQSSEEGVQSGAELMVNDGVMDDIDVIIGLHVENWLKSGTVGICKGVSMASSRSFKVEFFGKSAHASLPHSGKDAIAMAVRTYNNTAQMLAREIDPFKNYICSIGKLSGGTTQNVIADYAEMCGTIRTFDENLDSFIINRIKNIAKNAAEEVGASYKVTTDLKCFPLYNNPALSDRVLNAAEKIVGKENIADMPVKISSEDFSQYLTKKPGVFFRLGTKTEGNDSLPHNSDFMIDENALSIGSDVCVQFVLDNMNGIEENFMS